MSRLASFVPLAVVVAAAGIVVALQPVTSPWWINADADSTYSASALNIISGRHSHFFGHPGLPEEEVLAITFGAVSLAHGGPTHAWAASEMTHLDRARPVFRAWAILFFVGGAALAYLLVRRLLGHWTWGLAGGLMWLAMPDLTDTIQIRPDVLLSALMLLTGFVLVRGWERRSAGAFVLAAAIAGFALMTKLHAVAIVPVIVLATVLARPAADWWPRLAQATKARASRHRVAIGIAVSVWAALFLILNRGKFTIIVSNAHPKLLAAIVVIVAAYAGVAWLRPNRVFDRLYLALGAAFALGMAIPLSLQISDSPRALIETFQTLIGRNINAGVKPFSYSLSEYLHFPLLEALFVVALAGVAAAVGVRTRNAWPGLWFTAAALTTLLAALREGTPRYFAPGYVLAIPAALWLFRRHGSAAAPLVVWALVAAVVIPTLMHVRDPAAQAQREEEASHAATALADRLLKPHQVAVVPDYTFDVPDARWFGLVALYTPDAPAYPYRFVPADNRAIAAAAGEGKRVALYIGPPVEPGPLTLANGTYRAGPVAGRVDGLVAVPLRAGPGT